MDRPRGTRWSARASAAGRRVASPPRVRPHAGPPSPPVRPTPSGRPSLRCGACGAPARGCGLGGDVPGDPRAAPARFRRPARWTRSRCGGCGRTSWPRSTGQKPAAALMRDAVVRDVDGGLVLTVKSPVLAQMMAAQTSVLAEALYEEFGGGQIVRGGRRAGRRLLGGRRVPPRPVAPARPSAAAAGQPAPGPPPGRRRVHGPDPVQGRPEPVARVWRRGGRQGAVPGGSGRPAAGPGRTGRRRARTVGGREARIRPPARRRRGGRPEAARPGGEANAVGRPGQLGGGGGGGGGRGGGGGGRGGGGGAGGGGGEGQRGARAGRRRMPSRRAAQIGPPGTRPCRDPGGSRLRGFRPG